jgi:CRISPR-associated endonuclease/helicase Cas3
VPTIIYANIVSRAQAYYNWFKNEGFNDVVLYHSRFIEPHKVEKEARLVEMLGRKAWAEGRQRGVAVLTQIGEISVNISADLMISDLCPLDRLAQRAGRLSRFAERGGSTKHIVGELYVVEPYRLNKKTGQTAFYPAPYGTYVPNKGWEPSEALSTSGELLRDSIFSAKTFVDLVNRLYPTAAEPQPHVRDNRRALEDCVISNWLILPKEIIESNDDHTMNWKCRDIPPQYTVYAGYESSGFLDEPVWQPRNKTELREWEIRHGINCHTYEFNLAFENGLLNEETFIIGDERVKRFTVRPAYYNSETGLDFTVRDGDNDYE